jgi:hypothetical protein
LSVDRREYSTAGADFSSPAAVGVIYAALVCQPLQNLLTRSQVLANDGSTALLRVGPDAGLP